MFPIPLLALAIGCAATGAPATRSVSETADELIFEYDANRPPDIDPAQIQSLIYWIQHDVESKRKIDNRRAIAKRFVAEFPNHKEAPKMMFALARMLPDKDEALALYRRIVERYPTTEFAAAAAGQLRQHDTIGKPFQLSFTDAISGKQVSMAGFQGKVIVIDFWSSWCGPCIAEMPKLEQLYAKYKDQGVEFIGVSLDQPENEGGMDQLKQSVERNKIPWPQYYQGDGIKSEFSFGWGIDSIPRTFLIDRNGNLFSTDARDKLEEMLPELLAKKY